MLRDLEAKGLVERPPHPTDARARALTAPAAGVDLANRATTAVEQVDRDYFAALGADRPAFTRMLAQLTPPRPCRDRPGPSDRVPDGLAPCVR